MICSVIGWVDAWGSPYKQVPFTEERRKALIERIRKRRYNFTYETHQNLPYSAPFYNDKVLCVLTKSQWDSVMDEAYKDAPIGARLIPMDVITVFYMKRKNIKMRRICKMRNEEFEYDDEAVQIARCETCGEPIYDNSSEVYVDEKHNYFCSLECALQYYGIHLSEDILC